MNSRQEFEKIYSVENQANVMTEALFEIFNKGWEAARKPKYTEAQVYEVLDDAACGIRTIIIRDAIDALIEAGILTVKGADANDD